ncbi:tetratricopeptide repeat protein [Synechococcus sp. MIT S9508]|uniref:tetratricopeptide repeat protein n=1 Tax=Synechococcus sp. MIT S9508 TaxID=1801629 RepID=UPI0007BBDA8A|nr:tetratricopeptide repeat protein [Synechococcus sp. MIT S9508]KZR87471.1 Tetratricopeptide repeat [Synechococcus sp. MIT S9508]
MTGFRVFRESENNKKSSKKREDIQLIFLEARDCELRFETAKAEKAYEKIIKSGCYHSEAFFNLGAIYYESGRLKQALNLYQKIISVKPNLAHAHLRIGTIYKDLGFVDLARNAILDFLELCPESPRALLSIMSVHKIEDLKMLKLNAVTLLRRNPSIVENLDFIEFVSTLGEDFYHECFSGLELSVAFKDV